MSNINSYRIKKLHEIIDDIVSGILRYKAISFAIELSEIEPKDTFRQYECSNKYSIEIVYIDTYELEHQVKTSIYGKDELSLLFDKAMKIQKVER